MKAKLRITTDYVRLKRTMRDLDLVTVCEEAGLPQHLRVLVRWHGHVHDQRRALHPRPAASARSTPASPAAIDAGEPARVAEAVARMGLSFAVVTAVARDDLADGGAAAFAETIQAIRRRNLMTKVEVLIPDCKGDPDALRRDLRCPP